MKMTRKNSLAAVVLLAVSLAGAGQASAFMFMAPPKRPPLWTPLTPSITPSLRSTLPIPRTPKVAPAPATPQAGQPARPARR